ncbi:outer membrane protein assembly factor BamA [bacterium]|nr:outer membrane protein assembly factor BamA [bacterium]
MKHLALLFLIIGLVIPTFGVNYNDYEGKYIEDVKFVHDKDLDSKDDDLRLILRIEKGTTFSIKSLNEDITEIWGFGYYDNIAVDLSKGEIGIIVEFRFTDKSHLKEIHFTGNEEFSGKRLLDKCELTGESKEFPPYYDEYLFLEALKKLKKYYMKKGYFNVKISKDVTDAGDFSKSVTYEIEEGDKFFISEIEIKGVEAFTQKKIASALKIKKRSLMSRGYYDQQKIEDGLNGLREFYKKNGFISARIELEEVETVEGSIRLHVAIDEGKPFNIGEVDISFGDGEEPVIPVERLRARAKKYSNAPYSDEIFDAMISDLRILYTDLGYLGVLVDSKKVFDLEGSKVNVILKVKQGEQAFISTISIKPIGAQAMKTKPWVLLREMYVEEDSPFSVKELQETQQKLYNLNYFDNIYPIYTQVSGTNSYDLIWYAKEKPTGKAQLGGGYSNEEKLIGFVEIGESNLLGYGYKLNFKYEHSQYRDDFNLNFTDPWFLNPWVIKGQIAFGLDIYHQTFDRYELFYTELKNGFSLRFGKNFWRYYQVNLQLRHDDIRLDVEEENMQSAPADVTTNLGWNVTNAISLSFSRDQRDYFFNPTRGSKFSISSTLAGDFIKTGDDDWFGFGGNAHYLKIVTQAEVYKPLFWKFVLGLRAQFGFIQSFSDQKIPPVYERFFMGGDYSVRGYEDRSIGYTELAFAREHWTWLYSIWGDTEKWVIVNPDTGDWIDPYTGVIIDKDTGDDQTKLINSSYYKDYGVSYYPIGGTKLFNFNAEYKFPIYGKQFWGALFYDAGYIWTDIYRDIDGDGELDEIYSEPFSLKNFKLAHSIGFGIRFEVPMLGVLRLDYAYGFSHPTDSEVGKNFSNTKLHFTIGNVF